MLKLILISLILSTHLFAETVQLNFSNMGNSKGRIALAVFDDPNSFPDGNPVLTKYFPISSAGDAMSTKLELVPGRYAIAVYLDANQNGVMDKNILGIPKERFGFSNNPSVHFSAPNFNECEIEVSSKINNNVSVRFLKLL